MENPLLKVLLIVFSSAVNVTEEPSRFGCTKSHFQTIFWLISF